MSCRGVIRPATSVSTLFTNTPKKIWWEIALWKLGQKKVSKPNGKYALKKWPKLNTLTTVDFSFVLLVWLTLLAAFLAEVCFIARSSISLFHFYHFAPIRLFVFILVIIIKEEKTQQEEGKKTKKHFLFLVWLTWFLVLASVAATKKMLC